MRKIFLLFALVPAFIHAQDCNCKSSFDWLKETFEQNDAGYPMVIKQKGQRAYQEFSDSIADLTRQINNHKECVALLDEWVHFFRKGHVGVYLIDNSTKSDSKQNSAERNSNAETYPIDISAKEKEELSIYRAKEPLMQRLNDETLLLRIPSFHYKNKTSIDAIIKNYNDSLASTENLVIDLRGNGGGSDASMMRIIPYIYTNPIKSYSVEIRSTPLTYEAYKEWFSRSFFGRVYFALSLKRKLKKNMGNYVSRSSDTVNFRSYYTVRDYPKNVFVLVDGKCASTTEQFLLYAEQSSKTTIVGQTTFGAIDVSNVNPITFPNQKYGLSYTCSRSLRMHYRIIDDIGIEPNIFIPDSIPNYKWLRYVEQNILPN